VYPHRSTPLDSPPVETVLPGQFERWVARFLTRRALSCVLGAVGCLLAAAVVLWLTWWTIYFILWFIVLSFSPPALAISVATWVVWGLLFVAYFTANWPRLETLEFEAPSKMRVARIAAILTDSPFLALTGPKTVGSFVKVVSVIALVGPGIVMTSWKLLQMALAGFRGSADKVADVLKSLATAGARLSLEELIRSDPTDSMPATFAAVRLFDGVIFRSSEPVGLVLTDRLRDEILAQLPADQRHPLTTKPPAVRVSSPTRPSSSLPTKPTTSAPAKPISAAPVKPNSVVAPTKPSSVVPPKPILPKSLPAKPSSTASSKPTLPKPSSPKPTAAGPDKPNGVAPAVPRPKPRPKPPE